MFAAKYVKSNSLWGNDTPLEIGQIYLVNGRKTHPDSLRIWLEGFDESFNISCFEFFEMKKISRDSFEKKCSKKQTYG